MRMWILALGLVACLGAMVIRSMAVSARIDRADGRGSHGSTDPDVQRGLDAYANEKYPEARHIAEEMLAARNRGSTHAEAIDLLAESWLAQGDFSHARAAVVKYQAEDPQTARDALARIDTREKTYRTELSRYQAQKAAASRPKEAAEVQLRIGHLYQEFGRLDLAETAYRDVVASYPHTEAAHRAQRQLNSLRGKPSLPHAP